MFNSIITPRTCELGIASVLSVPAPAAGTARNDPARGRVDTSTKLSACGAPSLAQLRARAAAVGYPRPPNAHTPHPGRCRQHATRASVRTPRGAVARTNPSACLPPRLPPRLPPCLPPRCRRQTAASRPSGRRARVVLCAARQALHARPATTPPAQTHPRAELLGELGDLLRHELRSEAHGVRLYAKGQFLFFLQVRDFYHTLYFTTEKGYFYDT